MAYRHRRFAVMFGAAAMMAALIVAVLLWQFDTPELLLRRRVHGARSALLVGLFLSLGCYPILAGVFAQHWLELRTFRRALGWPTAAGRIEASFVQMIRTRVSELYLPKVHYTFTVNGRSYAGETLRFGSLGSAFAEPEEADAHAQLAAYPPGAAARIAYDPDDPTANALAPVQCYEIGKLGLPWWFFLVTLTVLPLVVGLTRL